MGCEGCLPGLREKQEQIKSQYKNAKRHAIEHQKNMALYFLENGMVGYIEASEAIGKGIPVIEFVSYLPDIDNG